jgi:hypothetical protein
MTFTTPRRQSQSPARSRADETAKTMTESYGTPVARGPSMSSRRFLVAAVLGMAMCTLTSSSARADPPAAQEYRKETPPGEYQAPMSQQTQPSYVPQSVAMSGPREIRDYNEGDPVPPGYTPVERTRRGLVIGGAVTFGVLYLISALVAAAGEDTKGNGDNEAAALWIPAVGPFIQMFNTDSAVANVFLAIDGIAQSGGLAMFVIGLTSPKTVLVRNDLASAPKPTLRPAPIVTGNTTGFGLVGTF